MQRVRYVIRSREGMRLEFACLSSAIEKAHHLADLLRHDVLVQTPSRLKVAYRAETIMPKRRQKRYDVNGKLFYRIDNALKYARVQCLREAQSSKRLKLYASVRVYQLEWDAGEIRSRRCINEISLRPVVSYDVVVSEITPDGFTGAEAIYHTPIKTIKYG